MRLAGTSGVQALNPNGCALAPANSQRSGFVVNPDGSIEERSGRFFNLDLRVGKSFAIGPKAIARVYVDFYNLFNTENLSFTLRPEQSSAASASQFLQVGVAGGPGIRTAGRTAVHRELRSESDVLALGADQVASEKPGVRSDWALAACQASSHFELLASNCSSTCDSSVLEPPER